MVILFVTKGDGKPEPVTSDDDADTDNDVDIENEPADSSDDQMIPQEETKAPSKRRE